MGGGGIGAAFRSRHTIVGGDLERRWRTTAALLHSERGAARRAPDGSEDSVRD